MMKKLNRLLAAAFACTIAGVGSAQAQISDPSLLTHEPMLFADSVYALEGPWEIWEILHVQYNLVGCRALARSESGPLIIGYGRADLPNFDTWELIVPGPAGRGGTNGTITADGQSVQGRFLLNDGPAIKTLSTQEVALLRSSSSVSVWLDGDAVRSWSLAGSAATMRMLQDCANGIPPSNAAFTEIEPRLEPNAAAWPPPISGQVAQMMTCSSIYSSNYPCRVTAEVLEPGFEVKMTYRVEDLSGAHLPITFLMHSATRAQVLIDQHNDPASSLGFWETSDANNPCMWPEPNQPPETRRLIGPTDWSFCAR